MLRKYINTLAAVAAILAISVLWTPVHGQGGAIQFDSSGNAKVAVENGSLVLTEAATQTAGQANIAATLSFPLAYNPANSNYARVIGRSATPASTDIGFVVRPFGWTDGTNTAPTMDAAARPGFQKITDGTNTLPTMDVAARKGFVIITDGTNSITVHPCDAQIPTTVPISFASSSAQKVITKASSKKNYICSMTIVAGAAEILNIWEGTQTTNQCDTSTAAVVGSTTAANGMSFAANGGFSISFKAISGIGTNVDTCLVTSGSNRISGYLTYVQQ